MNAQLLPTLAISDLDQQAKAHAEQTYAKAINSGSVLTLHTYTDAHGQPIYWKARVKHASDKKDIRALCVNDGRLDKDGKPLQGQFIPYEPKFSDLYPIGNGKKPLYRLHELLNADAGQAVWVVEGEQKADYLAELGFIATTSGGASSGNTTDWQPLAGRKVIIWPDFDKSGVKYQSDITSVLSGLGGELWALDVSQLGLPEKGDVIDFARIRGEDGEDTTAADIEALLMVQIDQNHAKDSEGIYVFGEKTSESSSPSSPSSQNGDDLATAMERLEAAFTAADGGEGDVGAFWEEDVIEAVCYIHDHSKPEWARIRHRMKKVKGLKITDYDREIIPQSDGSDDKNAASAIIEMAAEQCSYIHDLDGEAYALLTVENVRQCHRLESKAYTEWLSYQYYTSESTAPSDTSIKAAVAAMTGKAKFEGEQHEVFTRIAKHDGAYWLDLCNDQWQAIRITPQGWQVIDNPPVIFVRGASMRPLPMPIQGEGNLAALWQMANIPEADRLMVVAWLLECLRPETPFVVLELSGEQGSAKSSTQSALRDLIDPNKSNLRTAPKQKDDVFISARNSHMVSFENLSHLSADYQDALCSLATGAGYATRTLYSNLDETTMELKKPIMLNGISIVVTAQDLLDRTLHIDLPMLESVSTEADLAAYWETNYAAAFTGLLDAFSSALAYIDRVDLSGEKLPRMADFTILGEAVYMAHGQPPKAFLHDYRERRKEGVNRTLESSPVAVAMLALLDRRPQGFVGTVKGLLQELEALSDEYSPHWPKSAKGLGDAIQRLKPAFRQIGILLEKDSKPSRDGVRCTLKRM